MGKQEGVTFMFNSWVVGADCASGCVELYTGEHLYADIIVSADGYDSILWPLVTEFHEFENQDLYLILNLIIPLDLHKVDKYLAPLTNPRVVSEPTQSG